MDSITIKQIIKIYWIRSHLFKQVISKVVSLLPLGKICKETSLPFKHLSISLTSLFITNKQTTSIY